MVVSAALFPTLYVYAYFSFFFSFPFSSFSLKRFVFSVLTLVDDVDWIAFFFFRAPKYSQDQTKSTLCTLVDLRSSPSRVTLHSFSYINNIYNIYNMYISIYVVCMRIHTSIRRCLLHIYLYRRARARSACLHIHTYMYTYIFIYLYIYTYELTNGMYGRVPKYGLDYKTGRVGTSNGRGNAQGTPYLNLHSKSLN